MSTVLHHVLTILFSAVAFVLVIWPFLHHSSVVLMHLSTLAFSAVTAGHYVALLVHTRQVQDPRAPTRLFYRHRTGAFVLHGISIGLALVYIGQVAIVIFRSCAPAIAAQCDAEYNIAIAALVFAIVVVVLHVFGIVVYMRVPRPGRSVRPV